MVFSLMYSRCAPITFHTLEVSSFFKDVGGSVVEPIEATNPTVSDHHINIFFVFPASHKHRITVSKTKTLSEVSAFWEPSISQNRAGGVQTTEQCSQRIPPSSHLFYHHCRPHGEGEDQRVR